MKWFEIHCSLATKLINVVSQLAEAYILLEYEIITTAYTAWLVQLQRLYDIQLLNSYTAT